jgi:hypothetical protein
LIYAIDDIDTLHITDAITLILIISWLLHYITPHYWLLLTTLHTLLMTLIHYYWYHYAIIDYWLLTLLLMPPLLINIIDITPLLRLPLIADYAIIMPLLTYIDITTDIITLLLIIIIITLPFSLTDTCHIDIIDYYYWLLAIIDDITPLHYYIIDIIDIDWCHFTLFYCHWLLLLILTLRHWWLFSLDYYWHITPLFSLLLLIIITLIIDYIII